MLGKQRRLPAAAFAGGLAAFVALAGCGGEQSVASRSAAAFREAQKKGETFEDTGHSHGGHAAADASAGAADHADHANHEAATPGHDHGGAGASPDHSAMGQGSQAHAGHAGMDHGQSHQGHTEPGKAMGQDERSSHTGHAAMSPQAPPAGAQAPSGGHEGHTGHSPAHEGMEPATAVAAPKAAAPGQPAGTLKPDALDAPAATSVADAQRSAEIAEEMSGAGSQGARGGHEGHGGQGSPGGHSGHGSGTYVHVDAGRETAAQEESHDHHGHGMEPGEESAEVYVCPMHPEVTSSTPGKCPKCGMDLVKEKKE
jgi:heavy metal-binding protein